MPKIVTFDDLVRVDRSAVERELGRPIKTLAPWPPMSRRSNDPDTVPSPDQRLRQMVEDCGSQRAVAASLGVSPQFINDVLKGRRGMTEALADKLGYQRVVTFLVKPEITEADYCDDCRGYHKTGKCSAR